MKTQILTLLIGATLSLNAFADGGVDGGGGGTLPADPIHISHVRKILQFHKVDLRMVLKKMAYFAEMSPSSLVTKLFSGKKNMLTAVDEFDIEIREDRPCYSSSGKEVDASIYANRPKTICLSAFTIAPKLIEERARTEILALIGHELAHTLGASEVEAIEFQKDLAWNLKRFDAKLAGSYANEVSVVAATLKHELLFLSEFSYDPSNKNFQRFLSSSYELRWKLLGAIGWNHLVRVHDGRESDWLEAQAALLDSALLFATSIGENGEDSKNLYAKIFQKSDRISLEDYQTALAQDSENRFGKTFVITKITSTAQLAETLRVLSKYFDQLSEVAHAYHVNYPIPQFDEPWTISPNPWRKFIGTYRVLDQQCAADGTNPIQDLVTEFEVVEQGGQLNWIKRSPNSMSTHFLENGMQDVGGVVSLDTNGKSAIRYLEQGNLWSTHHSKSIEELKSVAGGFEFKTEANGKTNYSGVPKYWSKSCSFKLEKL